MLLSLLSHVKYRANCYALVIFAGFSNIVYAEKSSTYIYVSAGDYESKNHIPDETSVHPEHLVQLYSERLAQIQDTIVRYAKQKQDEQLLQLMNTTSLIIDTKMELPGIGYAIYNEGPEVHISLAFLDLIYGAKEKHLAHNAILDVVLHEYGHHATKSLYEYYASPRFIEYAEYLADDWANKVKEELRLDQAKVGKLFTLSKVYNYLEDQPNSKKALLKYEMDILKSKLIRSCAHSKSEIAQQLCVM